MQFKNLAKGYTIYILEKETLKVNNVPIIDISAPHFDANFQCNSGTQPMIQVCDITINVNGNVMKYIVGSEEQVVATGINNNTIITPNKENIFRELEAIKNESEDVLNRVDWYKNRIKECTTLMSEYSPEYRGKKEIEDRLSKVEKGIGKINDIEIMLKQILNKANKGTNRNEEL